MSGKKVSKRFLGRIRSSKLFIYTVVNLAVFIDAYIYGLIIPVLPFALVERVHLPEGEVQKWIGILLAAYGAGLIIGSRGSPSLFQALWNIHIPARLSSCVLF